MEFTLLIIGGDANAYYMARCYHEKYQKKAYLLGKEPLWFTDLSKIVIPKYNDLLWQEKVFLEELLNFKNEHPEKVLLVASAENYIELISKNQKLLKDKFYFNYPDSSLIKTIINKEAFYKTYENSLLSLPKTIYYDLTSKNEPELTFNFPVIVKPADVVSYRKLEFGSKHKIFKIESLKELKKTIADIKASGYKETLIIQEYIKGDDSYLFDVVTYSDKHGKVKRISFAQIGLQEHKREMIGNAAVLINGFSTFDVDKKILYDIITFLEEINYHGFAEFDLKYDLESKTFKVLEINPRQGRCSYYLTPIGCNLIEILADDLINDKKLKLEILDKKVLLSFVNKSIIKKYIVNAEYKKEALSLWKSHVNPLKYTKDLSFKRRLALIKRNINYQKAYKNGYWKNN